jgi:hypothetical protein
MKIDNYTFTTGLLILFGMFVIYIRMRNRVESNIPIFFYVMMALYVNTYADGIPALPIYIGLVLTLLLRFEFMNGGFGLFIRGAEGCTLMALLYFCWKSMYA